MLLRKYLLAFFSLCAGGIVAAGIYVFLAIISVFVCLMGKTGTGKHTFLYETMITLGEALGNILDIYELPICVGPYLDALFACAYGLSVGIFAGCLVMFLAETLKTLPIIGRRIHLAVGLQHLIFALTAGKMAGSLVYFWSHIASPG